MDLVGGRGSLCPAPSDTSQAAATWFLLVVDEHTSWRWAWPVYSKKDVPHLVSNLLELLNNQFGLTPKRVHTDVGCKFAGQDLGAVLAAKGIIWEDAAAKAPQQNGIVERSVRTVS